MHFHHRTVKHDWRYPTHKQLGDEYASTCCSKNVPAPPVEAGLRNALFAQCIVISVQALNYRRPEKRKQE